MEDHTDHALKIVLSRVVQLGAKSETRDVENETRSGILEVAEESRVDLVRANKGLYTRPLSAHHRHFAVLSLRVLCKQPGKSLAPFFDSLGAREAHDDR